MTSTTRRITVETTVSAPLAAVWDAYTSPEAINCASSDGSAQ